MQRINSVVKIFLLLIIMFIVISFTNCGGGPGEIETGLVISYCPAHYVLDSPESLYVDIKYINKENSNLYVWFEGSGGESLNTFISNKVEVGPTNNDSLVVRISWKPFMWQIYESGSYNIHAHMDRDQWASKPTYTSKNSKICRFHRASEFYLLSRWSGNRQRVRYNETLNDTLAYKIRCLVQNIGGYGINNKRVAFQTNKGYFLENYSKTYDAISTTEQGIDGIAGVTLFCNELSNPSDSFDYVITASMDSAPPINFKVRCSNDEDSSRLDNPYCHKRISYPNGAEIKGDIFADNTPEDPHYGSGNNYKDIKLEIDYDPNVVDPTELARLLGYALDALESAKEYSSGPYMNSGIKVKMDPICGTFTCPDSITEEETRNILSQTREHNDHIHCLIATRQTGEPNLLGMAFLREYMPSDGDYSWRTFHIGAGSSGSGMQDSLNRCGAVIFAKSIRAICNTYHLDFCEYAGMILAHEIGHCLMMGHTLPDSFGKNFMNVYALLKFGEFCIDSFNFFNIKSLDDAYTAMAAIGGLDTVITGLSTREQGGVNTIGFNYFDRQGGMMVKQPLIALVGLSLLSSKPLPLKALNQISMITKNVLDYANPAVSIHGSSVICHFESENRIGVAWLELGKGNWSYNYVCLDQTGKIILDLRNFKEKRDYLEKFGLDWEIGVPNLDYVVDEKGNRWLIYAYFTEKGWRMGWVKVDSAGKIVEDVEDKIFEWSLKRQFIVCPSRRFGFHLLPGNAYFNPKLSVSVSLAKQYKENKIIPYPYPPEVCIEITSNKVLAIGYNGFSKQIHCQKISSKGKLLSLDALNIESVTSIQWENIDLPEFYETYRSDSLIYYLQRRGNSVNLVIFDNGGKLILPEQKVQGKVLGIEQMPEDAKRFIKIRSGVIYYFGLDDKGNLYYWNSKEGKE